MTQASQPPNSYQRWVARHARVLYCVTGGVTLLMAVRLVRAVFWGGEGDVVTLGLLTGSWSLFTAQVWLVSRTVAKYERQVRSSS
ncbi:hypothetical protein [Terrabacter sp. 2YAF2]|uniref:hypothetical protein n=1 Tax=Terrabacter sp. 2YAF2 TaxID=3233026 RepID=UPI003F9B1C30